MSYSLKYYPDPGIAYDIVKMLVVKLTTINTWSTYFIGSEYHDEDVAFIQNVSESFPCPDSELLLFTYIPANKRITFLSFILEKIIYTDFAHFSVHDFIAYFSNINKLTTDLYSYYLGNDQYTNETLEYSIRYSKALPDKIKVLLFGFSFSPEKYANLVSHWIQAYYDYIRTTLYSDSYSALVNDTFIDTIIQKYYSAGIKTEIHKNQISYSLSFTIPEYLIHDFSKKSSMLITTPTFINRFMKNTLAPPLSLIIDGASALRDKTRIAIIQCAMSNPTLSAQNISEMFSLSKTAVHNHLSILQQANLITPKHIDRRITYSFNSDGFSNLQNALIKLSKGDDLT